MAKTFENFIGQSPNMFRAVHNVRKRYIFTENIFGNPKVLSEIICKEYSEFPNNLSVGL